MANCPLRTADDISNAIKIFQTKKRDYQRLGAPIALPQAE